MRSEIVGHKLLAKVGRDIYGEDDPTTVYFKERPQRITKEGQMYVLVLKLPFVKKAGLEILKNEDELTIQIGNYRRDILLPSVLSLLRVDRATFKANELRITFVKGE